MLFVIQRPPWLFMLGIAAFLPTVILSQGYAQVPAERVGIELSRVRQQIGPAVVAVGRIPETDAGGLRDLQGAVERVTAWTCAVAITGNTVICPAHLLEEFSTSRYLMLSGEVKQRAVGLELIAVEHDYDLAVFVAPDGDLSAVQIAATGQLASGAFVLAVGNPRAIIQHGKPDLRLGVVSDAQRWMYQGSQGAYWLVTDATLELGSGGVAVFNMQAQLVGLGGRRLPQQALIGKMGYVGSCNDVFKDALAMLRKGKPVQPGAMGLAVGNRNGRVQVTSVLPGGPAYQAGMMVGDTLIEFDNSSMVDRADLYRRLFPLHAGRKVPLRWQRGTETYSGELQLTERSSRWPGSDYFKQEKQRDIQVRDLTALAPASIRELQSHRELTHGVILETVLQDSAAWSVGLRSGMIILQLNDQRIMSKKQLYQLWDFQRGPFQIQAAVVDGQAAIFELSGS